VFPAGPEHRIERDAIWGAPFFGVEWASNLQDLLEASFGALRRQVRNEAQFLLYRQRYRISV
jgi:hypothetical protein